MVRQLTIMAGASIVEPTAQPSAGDGTQHAKIHGSGGLFKRIIEPRWNAGWALTS